MGVWVIEYDDPYEDNSRAARRAAARGPAAGPGGEHHDAVAHGRGPARGDRPAPRRRAVHPARRERARRGGECPVRGRDLGPAPGGGLRGPAVIAVDTNILVHAHRRDSPFHPAAAARIRELAEGRAPWALPWPCLHEFYSLVTHPRVFPPPSTGAEAVSQVGAWLESPSVVLMSEGPAFWAFL